MLRGWGWYEAGGVRRNGRAVPRKGERTPENAPASVENGANTEFSGLEEGSLAAAAGRDEAGDADEGEGARGGDGGRDAGVADLAMDGGVGAVGVADG